MGNATFTAVRTVSGTNLVIDSTGGTTPVLTIDSGYVGQASITTVGTITSGTWNGTTLAVANGGTGSTTAAGALTDLGALPLAGGTMTGLLILSGNPVSSLGAVTKQYADAISAGLFVKAACYAGTTANLNATYNNGALGVGATLTNAGAQAAFSTDGVSPALNARILVINQTSTADNGIYTLTTVGTGATNWVLTRSTDYNTTANIQPGDFILITNGTLYANTAWIETDTVNTIGTDPIQFYQYGATNVVSVNGTPGQIDSTGGTTPTISIDAGYVGQTSITTLGTIGTGVWNGTPVTVPYGGTGNTTFTAYSVLCAGTTATGTFQNVVGVGTTGQALMSQGASALPAWGNIAGSSWIDQTGAAVTMTANTSYVADNAGLVTLTLPAVASFGSVFSIMGKGAGGWKLAQAASQSIVFGDVTTTSGTSGYLASSNVGDCVTVVCTTTNTGFTVQTCIGNLTYN